MNTDSFFPNVGRLGAQWNGTTAVACEYVNDGERVAVFLGWDTKPRAVYGTVTCAAGHHARVRLPDGAEVWRHVSDLARVRPAPATKGADR